MSNIIHLRDIILKQDHSFSICMTGGGTDLLPALLRGGKMSSVFMGAEIPYGTQRLNEIVDYKHYLEKAVSEYVAGTLAVYIQAVYDSSFGVGCTASLYSEGQREGRVNQAHLSIFNGSDFYNNHIIFSPLIPDREYQERTLAAFIMLNMVFFLIKDMPSVFYWNRCGDNNFETLANFFEDEKISNQDFVQITQKSREQYEIQ